MNELTPATKVSSDYVWAFPGSPVRIHLSLAVVSRLREQLFTGFDPSSAKEIGGLLLGKTHAGRVHITDVRSLNTSEDGRYFVLSNADKEHLRELIRKQHAEDSLPSVVGYFRSDLRGGIKLTQEDLALSKELFSDPQQVFLILSGKDSGTPTAGFFFWDTGSIFGEASFMQFPLDEKLLALPRTPFSPRESSEPPVEQNQSVSNIPPSPTRNKRSYLFIWAPGLLLLAIAGAAIVYRPFNAAPPQNTAAVTRPVISSPMSLSATRADQNVIITWDSRQPAVSEARIGILTIKDGSSQTEFPLTRAQLQISKMIFVTPADRLELTLEVFSPDGKSTRESMMLAFTQPATKSRSRLSAATVVAPKVVAPKQEEIRTPVVENGRPTSVRTFTAAASAPTRTAPPERSVIINDAPPPAQVSTFDPAGIKAPDFLAPSPVKQAAPKSPNRTITVNRTSPLQPPVAIRQVRPVVPPNVNAMLKRRVDVQVRVSIDQSGRVVKAEPVVSQGGINQYLGTNAANTARLWTFQPARRGDTPVMSELILNFTFGPANKQE